MFAGVVFRAKAIMAESCSPGTQLTLEIVKERLMKKFVLLAVFTTITLVAAPFALAGASGKGQDKEAQEQAKLASQAKITKEQAQETALKRAPGTVESGELEKEHGKLVYSFDIRNAKGTITEVQVSAITGKIVRIEHESKKQEAAEKKKEKH
jgi:uncharacterized membrane protein YkoI